MFRSEARNVLSAVSNTSLDSKLSSKNPFLLWKLIRLFWYSWGHKISICFYISNHSFKNSNTIKLKIKKTFVLVINHFNHSFIYSFFIYLFLSFSFFLSFFHSFIHSFIHSFTHSFIHSRSKSCFRTWKLTFSPAIAVKNLQENLPNLTNLSRNVTTSARELTTWAWTHANRCRQDGAICLKKKKLSHAEAYHLELGGVLLSHIIGTHGGLRSPSPIMAPVRKGNRINASGFEGLHYKWLLKILSKLTINDKLACSPPITMK